MFVKYFYFLILFFSPFVVLASNDTICLGPKKASHFAIYLHGMDSVVPSIQELQNRETLEKIANKLNLRIAIPRATNRCLQQPNLLCWGWDENTSLKTLNALKDIPRSAEQCFSNKSYGLIGFSNGGFLINKIVQFCVKNSYEWLISVGAAGSWSNQDPADLSKCSSLSMIIGKKDSYNYNAAKTYASRLRELNAQIKLVEFNGEHIIPYREMSSTLNHIFSKKRF